MNIAVITASVAPNRTEMERVERFLHALATAIGGGGVPIQVYMTAEPEGFARSMNQALRLLIEKVARGIAPAMEYILCINDDVTPTPAALEALWENREDRLVTCPTTNFTGCDEQRATGPEERPAFRASVTPAICWLIPFLMIGPPLELFGGLFDESLGRAHYEDNLTAKLWQKQFGPQPFLIVPRAWMHHVGEVTSRKIPLAERVSAKDRYEARVKELGL